MRRHDIDNLRNFTILLLFPVHTFMIWNDFGDTFYIWMGESRLLSTLIVLINPWFMPLLFAIAGISAGYALEKRTPKAFAVQRTRKLLVPFLCGTVLLVPFQTLFARKFFYAYDGGVVENWLYFFTHFTDFSGYDGAFTPGHLWFILFLFVISMASLPLFRLVPYEKAAGRVEKIPIWGLLLLFLPVWLLYYLGNFGGFSLGKALALFLIGFYILRSDRVMERVERHMKWLVPLWGAGTALSGWLYYRFSYYGDLWVNFIGWVSILTLLALAKKFLHKLWRFTAYMNRAAYPIYILHQSILVAWGYMAVRLWDSFCLQVLCICAGSLVLTVLAYQIVKRIPVVREAVGIQASIKRKAD